ncbi:hypothetical protein ACHAPJ_008238 [Fusarium lateritium]
MNNNNNYQYTRPQRPYMRDPGVRIIIEQQEALNFHLWQVQCQLANQQYMMMEIIKEMNLMRLELRELKDRFNPGLGGSSVGSGATQGDGPMTPNTFYHYTQNVHHTLDTSGYTNL